MSPYKTIAIIAAALLSFSMISPQDAVETGNPPTQSFEPSKQQTETNQLAAEALSNKLAILLLQFQQQQQQQQQANKSQGQSPLPSSLPLSPSLKPLEVSRRTRNQAVTNASNNISPLVARQRWRQMESSVVDSLGELATRLNSSMSELSAKNMTISHRCKASIDELLEALARQQLWATKMLDASAHRLPSGFLEGTMTELGNFDQCLALKYQSQVADEPATGSMRRDQASLSSTGMGQYCSILIRPPLVARQRLHTVCQRSSPLSLAFGDGANDSGETKLFKLLAQNNQHFYYAGIRLGVCIPNKCQKSDLQNLVNSHLAKYQLIGQVKSCQLQDNNDGESLEQLKLDSVQRSIIFLMVAWLIITLIGTAIDFGLERRKRRLECLGGVCVGGKLATESFNSSLLGQHFMPRSLASDCENLDLCSGVSQSEWQSQRMASIDTLADGRWYPAGCQLHPRQQAFSQASEPIGIQRNPLVSEGQAAAAKLSHSSLAEEPIDKLDGASWLLALERQRAAAGAAPKRKFRARKSLPRILEPESAIKLASGFSFAELMVCFSIRSNLRILTKVATSENHRTGSDDSSSTSDSQTKTSDESSSEIKAIHGLRVLAMIWIIFGHTIGLVNPEMMNNLFTVAHLSCSSRLLQALLNATLAVNTFFMISGLVTAVSLLRRCQSAHLLLVSSLQQPLPSASALSRHTNLPANCSQQQLYRQQCGHAHDSSSPSSNSSLLDSLSEASSGQRCLKQHPAGLTMLPKLQVPFASSHQLLRERRSVKRQAHSASWWPSDFRPLTWLAMRYLRLTPAYGATITLALLMPALGSGPFWQESAGQMGASCRSLWWTNLLYVNNFVQTDRLCLIHSWYLSNDCQFFLVALILMATSYRSKGAALVLLVALFAASSAATFAITVSSDFPPTIVSTSPAIAERWQFIHQLYYKPWPHLPSYLVGLIVGYLVVLRERIELGKWGRRCGWFASGFLALALLNSIYPWNMGLQVEPLIAGIHSSTFRTLWACCCGWLIWALATRPHSQAAKLFGWHGFRLLSRLTYCAYLVHPLVIYYHFGTLRERMDSSIYGQSHRFMGTLLMSYLAALLLSLFVETPSIQLLRLMSRSRPTASSGLASNRYSRDRKISASSGQSSSSQISWSQTSGFSDQQNLVKSTGHEQVLPQMLATDQLVPPVAGPRVVASSLKQPDEMAAAAQRHAGSSDSNLEDTAAAAAAKAMDTEFQRKLSQAIGRGFRIRSRLAAGGSHSSLSPAEQLGAVQPPVVPAECRRMDFSSFVVPTCSDISQDSRVQERARRPRDSRSQARSSRSQDLGSCDVPMHQ